MVVFVCGVSMYHGSILNSTLLAGGPSGRTRKTCFYPWKACPSHKVLNPRVPVKGNGRGTSYATVWRTKSLDVPVHSKCLLFLLLAFLNLKT